MPGIDYSKWDRLNCSSTSSSDGSSDDDHDEYRGGSRSPRVTRLEYPSCVTTGPNGVQLVPPPREASTSPFLGINTQCTTTPGSSGASAFLMNPGSSSADPGGTKGKGTSDVTGSTIGTRQGGQERVDAADDDEDLLYERLARNGGREGSHHWWAQTEDTVTVSFLVPWETNSKSVTAFRLYEGGEVPVQESGQRNAHLEITIHLPPARVASTSGAQAAPPSPLYISKVFRYPVKLSEDLIDGCWQLHRMPKRHLRLLVVQLFKESLGLGMVLWWDRCFSTDTISVIADTRTLPGRMQRAEATPGSRNDKVEQFRKVWADAHEEFRRRVQERKQKEIE
ncbi:hypothetical protein JKF63_01249 [Porcisia hertigi]|uniref:CS domain-containing protein n=1 Tax=Porcisia hertigi TaxID=2761500 RepID=A0A836ICK9_9TRYP|nr:hypothetical protein JKF63_01249 [Porcisia hertigi]